VAAAAAAAHDLTGRDQERVAVGQSPLAPVDAQRAAAALEVGQHQEVVGVRMIAQVLAGVQPAAGEAGDADRGHAGRARKGVHGRAVSGAGPQAGLVAGDRGRQRSFHDRRRSFLDGRRHVFDTTEDRPIPPQEIA
jgi:hypothetical protein